MLFPVLAAAILVVAGAGALLRTLPDQPPSFRFNGGLVEASALQEGFELSIAPTERAEGFQRIPAVSTGE